MPGSDFELFSASLKTHRPQLEALAGALLEKETLEAAEIQAIIEAKPQAIQ